MVEILYIWSCNVPILLYAIIQRLIFKALLSSKYIYSQLADGGREIGESPGRFLLLILEVIIIIFTKFPFIRTQLYRQAKMQNL